MSWRHFGFEFVLLVVICVAALFFFPVAHGSYSAVHGPVTALRSIKYRLRIWMILAMAPYRVLRQRLVGGSRRFFRLYTESGFFFCCPEQVLVLRC